MFKISWYDTADQQICTAIVGQIEAARSLILNFADSDFYFEVSLETMGNFESLSPSELFDVFKSLRYPYSETKSLRDDNVQRYWITEESLASYVQKNVERIVREYNQE